MISKLWKNGWICGLSAVGALMAVAAPSSGSLVIQLKPAGGASGITVSNVGQVVPLEVYAVVTGKNATADEQFQSMIGSFEDTITGSGSAIGSFGPFVASAPFGAAPFGGTNLQGKAQQLGAANSGLDRGSFDITNANYSGQDVASARSASPNTAAQANALLGFASPADAGKDNAVGDVSTFLLGKIDWTVTATPNAGTTTLRFKPLTNGGTTDPTASLWGEDNGANQLNPSSGTFSATTVTVAVHEPASIGLLGLTGVGLLARRRRTA